MQAKIPLGHSGWRTGLLFAWAIWWGGLSFYALFVVPIGTEIVGGFEQGLITQRVTNWLNAIGVIVTLGFGVDVWISECNTSKIVIWLLVTISQLGLLVLHPLLDVQLELTTRTIRDPSWFYECHRAYLIATAASWLAGLSLAWLTFRGGQRIAKVAPVKEIQ